MIKKEGPEGIDKLGHREYVGGRWEEIGKLQFEFMLKRGLQQEHCLLDIACGSLRGGVHFINYLIPGNYLGLEKENKLIELGIEKELGPKILEMKRPEFVLSENFEFQRFSKIPDFSIAQSLFTHLTVEHISLCLNNLRAHVKSEHECYATYFQGDSKGNPKASHSHDIFYYYPEELMKLGKVHNWRVENIGDWGHPWNQQMMLFTAI